MKLGPLGLTLPNRHWEPYRAAELRAARALRPAALVALLFEEQAIGVRRRQVEQVRELVALLGCRLILRPWTGAALERSPTAWAATCSAWAAWFGGPGLRVELTPANEPNRTDRPADGDRQATWLLAFAARYRALRPDDVLHLPAPWSGEPGEGSIRALRYWRALAERGVHAAYDRIDSQEFGEEIGLHAHAWRLFGKPVDVIAFNGADPVRVAAEVRAHSYLGVACWFLLAGGQDQRPNWLLRSPWEAAFREAQGVGADDVKNDAELVALEEEHVVRCYVRATTGGILVWIPELETSILLGSDGRAYRWSGRVEPRVSPGDG